MSSIGTISMKTPASVGSVERQANETFRPVGPTALPQGQPRMLALGLEGLIALLSEEGAKQMRKDAREQQRAERDAQLNAVERQVNELYAKAAAMRHEAIVTASFAVAGGVAQVGGAASGGANSNGRSSAKALLKAGEATTSLSGPMGKLSFGGRQVERDADATRAAADAKRAESMAEEYASLVKSADATIDKAHQALQSLVQMRMQLMQQHGVYRPA